MNSEHAAERLVLTAPRRLRWLTEELPAVGSDEVLVRTRAGAISIGSELPLYCGTSRAVRPAQYPRGLGYKNVGVVEACGAAVRRVRCGARVVAFMAIAHTRWCRRRASSRCRMGSLMRSRS